MLTVMYTIRKIIWRHSTSPQMLAIFEVDVPEAELATATETPEPTAVVAITCVVVLYFCSDISNFSSNFSDTLSSLSSELLVSKIEDSNLRVNFAPDGTS